MKKRLFTIAAIMGVLMLALAGRVAYIQILGHKDLGAAASAQQLIALEGANTRGLIYDRNNTPLVGNNREYIYIIRKEECDLRARVLLERAGAEELRNEQGDYKVYASDSYNRELGKQLIEEHSAYIIEAGRRYSEKQKAVHILGYINPQDASGASGLELMCNDELSLLNKKIFTTADVKGNIILGKGLVVSTAQDTDSYVKKGITTTLDAGLQGAIEGILDKTEKNGAIVVLKSQTGEVVASASTPTFDPSRVSEYMKSNRTELVNKVTQGEYPPGSVFKIVVAAAALEKGISLDTTFTCRGYETINGKRIKCKTGGEKGHGKINLKDAFAQSCNSTFIQLGEKLGAQTIIDTAKKMGLGTKILEDYPQEKAGNIMTAKQAAGAAIANLSIGQGETLMTPLQVAAMTNIIASGGIQKNIHLLLESETEGQQVISKETAEKLRDMMAETMISGSGKDLTCDVPMAGKTGSAESNQGKEEVVHGWMTGFVPAKDPEYTITVFVEDGEAGSLSAGPIFAEVAQYLSDSKSFERAVNF